jgi:CRISPR/Cas system-associated exonuclease Cas4 (RecB family)
MDILHLVDRLESLLTQSHLIPLTVYRLVDEDRALELIDQMRISIPDEIKKAKRIHQERDRIIAQAHEESSRLVELAQKEAAELVERDAISTAAERRAQTIIERAQRESLTIKLESDEYVMQVLSELEAHLMRSLTVVQNGLKKLEEERKEAEEQAAVSEGEQQ